MSTIKHRRGRECLGHQQHRHCEPTGRRKAPPDDRLREAIHSFLCRSMDCFVAEFIIGPAEGGTRWLLAMTII
jgi:hypothetical protein